MYLDRNLLRLLRKVLLPIGMSILAGIAAGIFLIIQAKLVSQVVMQVFVHGGGRNEVLPTLWIILGVIVIRSGWIFANERFSASAARQVKTILREQILAKLIRLGPLYTRRHEAGELSAVLLQGVDTLDAYFSQFIPQAILAATVPLAVLLFVFPVDWLSGIILTVTGPLIPFFMYLIGSSAERLTRRQFNALRQLSAFFLDTLQGLQALKELGQSRGFVESVREKSEHYRQTTMSVLRLTFLSALALELLATLSTAIIAVQVGLRLLYAKMDFEVALFLLLIAPEFYQPLRMLGMRFHAAIGGISALKRMDDLLAEPEWSVLSSNSSQRLESLPRFDPRAMRIEFREVTFRYPDRAEDALQRVSFTILPGVMTTLIGESGAGKSTILALLLRFVDPNEGEILVGNRALNTLEPEAWRKWVTWVPQRPYLIRGSILDNLRIAINDGRTETYFDALEKVKLIEWVEALPEGIHTPVGERGVRLSGGQAQRLALARAFLRNSPLLLMDEPTVYLDPPEEAILDEVVRDLSKQRTTLVIAHRMQTIQRAEHIIVLSDGKVIETRSRGDLIGWNGRFTGLWGANQEK
ncbi:thiol reductant ABC exporter, CydD subunit [Anaerolinea thermolimosa]|uniref:thiol reductant ABC exporter subunit CydD n=1 Tax=Anaerolinea thermolimosa TaxID=229919 RepID=UPI000782BC6A|nr:thiol reductant ABC exporter, CydD subunit [Anaerolinea thermolimosa]